MEMENRRKFLQTQFSLVIEAREAILMVFSWVSHTTPTRFKSLQRVFYISPQSPLHSSWQK